MEGPAESAGRRRPGPADNSAFLRLKELNRAFGATTALHRLSMDIPRGEFLTILGPSGSGKTTTLNLIAGFDFPTAGTILIGGRDVTWEPSYRRGLGMVFQNYALFPHMTVFENIAFPLRSRHLSSASIRSTVSEALELVQLGELAQRLPRQLSGGQQQRVALARSFVYRPAVLLMDEPLSALDRKLRADMQLEIKRLHRDLGTTIVYVTHDQDEALSMSDRIAVLHRGRLEQIAPPHEIYLRPASRFVASFVGDANFLSATVESGRMVRLNRLPARLALDGDLDLPAGTPVTVCARPEHLRLKPAAEGTGIARLEEILFLGDSVKCVLRLDDERLIIKLPLSESSNVPPIEDRVDLELDTRSCTIFTDAS